MADFQAAVKRVCEVFPRATKEIGDVCTQATEPGLKGSIPVGDSDFFLFPMLLTCWSHHFSTQYIVAETKQPSWGRRINAINGWCSIWRTQHVAIKLSKTDSSILLLNKQIGNHIFVSNILWGTHNHQEGKEQLITLRRKLKFWWANFQDPKPVFCTFYFANFQKLLQYY